MSPYIDDHPVQMEINSVEFVWDILRIRYVDFIYRFRGRPFEDKAIFLHVIVSAFLVIHIQLGKVSHLEYCITVFAVAKRCWRRSFL